MWEHHGEWERLIESMFERMESIRSLAEEKFGREESVELLDPEGFIGTALMEAFNIQLDGGKLRLEYYLDETKSLIYGSYVIARNADTPDEAVRTRKCTMSSS